MRACVHVSDVRVWTCNQTFTWLSVSSSWHHISPRKKKKKNLTFRSCLCSEHRPRNMKYQYQSFSAIPEKNKKMAPIPWRHNSGHSKGIVYVKRKPLKYTANLSLTHLYPYTYYPPPLLPSLFHSLRPLIHKKRKKLSESQTSLWREHRRQEDANYRFVILYLVEELRVSPSTPRTSA